MLQITHIEKSYGKTVALRGLDLTVPSGAVFGIAGPNGAGKSTLIRILAGEETEDAGTIELDGAPWTSEQRRVATAVVHQEPQLFPNLTVLQNLHFGLSLTGLRLPRRQPRETEVLEELGLSEFANRELSLCPLVVWQLTEIGRALLREARLFLFDEPNSALGEEESDLLFAQLRRLTEDPNHVVMMVSHRLGDLTQLSHRVAVIREGLCTEVLSGTDVTEHALARALVVGITSTAAERVRPTVAAADDEGRHGHRRGARLGESGRCLQRRQPQPSRWDRWWPSWASRALEGASWCDRWPASSRVAANTSSWVARLSDSAASRTCPRRGATASSPTSRSGPTWHRDWGPLRSRAGRGCWPWTGSASCRGSSRSRFRVVASSTKQGVATLSGGNQQKVALAGTMATRPRLLAVEEPTRGVDIGTKAEIYRTLRDFVRDGNAVVTFCTEVSEVFDVADVVYVTNGGRLSEAIDVHAVATIEELAAAVAHRPAGNSAARRQASTMGPWQARRCRHDDRIHAERIGGKRWL